MKRLLLIPLVLFLSYIMADNRDECEISVSYQSGWNLISLPVEIDDANYLSLFPNSIEGTLYFFTDNAYNEESEMIPGQGYWLRFPNVDIEIINGECVNELTISLNDGWNLISGGLYSVSVNDIIDDNGIIVENSIFGYDGNYFNADTIEVGKGYWVRTNSVGEITIKNPNTIEWILIPSGEYTYGFNDTILTIDYDFEIMKYEVTNAQYKSFLEELWGNGDLYVDDCFNSTHGDDCLFGFYNGGERVFYAPNGNVYDYNLATIQFDGTEFSIPDGFENHPVIYVTWFGANAFANHYGWGLPTEHEWEKTARGMTGADYPWGENYGDDISDNANYWNSGDLFDNGTTQIGYYNGQSHQGSLTTDSPSPYGVYDLAGNVGEWTNSFYGGIHPDWRVFRGGSWNVNDAGLCSNIRGTTPPTSAIHFIGFRAKGNL